MTANDIKDIILREYFSRGMTIANTNFSGSGLHECDILMINKNHFATEFEIKRSKSDFNADFKKVHKHSLLSNRDNIRDLTFEKHYGSGWFCCPNYFYYVCETNLIDLNNIPDYAGLIYVGQDSFSVIKRAPRLHKFKVTNRLFMSILHNLSARMIFGCSFLSYKRKKAS